MTNTVPPPPRHNLAAQAEAERHVANLVAIEANARATAAVDAIFEGSAGDFAKALQAKLVPIVGHAADHAVIRHLGEALNAIRAEAIDLAKARYRREIVQTIASTIPTTKPVA